MKLFFASLFLILLHLLPLNAQSYLSVTAKRGDGILVLLGRYGLDRSPCNLKKFCQLNKLKETDYLMVGKNYKLPILEYKYNGKSIRSTVGISSWQRAKQIERYNESMELFRLKTSFKTKNAPLWYPHHLKACAVNLEEHIPKGRHFSIFGKEFADVPLKDKKLAGAVYYLVSGHGGPDPGAVATYKGKPICEDEYAYDITLRLARELLSHGALVYLIVRDANDGIRQLEYLPKDEDERCWPSETIPKGQSERLSQRSDIINELYRENLRKGLYYQRLVEIHVDSRSKKQRIDLFFYHYPESLRGRELARRLHQHIRGKYQQHRASGEYKGTVKARDLHMLREVIPTPVFIEVGNIQNPKDQKRILLPANRQALADWLAEGLMKDY
ncbi:N-acetylmuramoyl-L-alanine amidase [Saprospira sp. CCB-QB6]|uniref:N-acetylmuramoyl-L-alanine amidase family protein n=1 Tax=Saprospira sp. CCB-QB6 TaxID=3023936 RepID=UPI00234B55B2|nr:N-acetylmuramoyl-L-alanine amidase [Saprospira sp. CCB-QB6]WCL81440.1 N-acetylmuramoyl-L-alanine amidase [Saprospira sp. CCB-QB6]